MSPLLDIRDLRVEFKTDKGIVKAVNGVSYTLEEGETLCVVGESGCGKSVHALSIMRLVPIPPGRIADGQIKFQGRDLLKMSTGEMQDVRGKDIAMIFQDPMTSLNPVLTIGYQITEALKLHHNMSEAEARERAEEMLTLVGIPEARQRLDEYPHQFSGGMRQRAMIAMALSCNPKLLIADEPTTALDVTIQAQIVELVKRLQKQFGMAVMWITHDLGVAAGLADRVNVMYAGAIIEQGTVRDIFKRPHHPYTHGLLNSLPRLDLPAGSDLFSIPGLPPDLSALPKGCAFAPRCPHVVEECKQEMPQLINIDGRGHKVACWRWNDIEWKR
ncbi:MAG: ABC transporter ATP-binding protein [Ardenticatenaceae bacterium]